MSIDYYSDFGNFVKNKHRNYGTKSFGNDVTNPSTNSADSVNNNSMLDLTNYLNQINSAATEAQYNFNAKQAQLNRDWQERVNSYQYMVEDLKKAGLNPALAYSNSAGYVGSGSSASGSRADTASQIASLYNAKLNAETSLKVAQINAAANIEASRNNNPWTYLVNYLGQGNNTGSSVDSIFDKLKNYGFKDFFEKLSNLDPDYGNTDFTKVIKAMVK